MTASHVTKPWSFSAHRQATTNFFFPNLFLFDFTAWFITASHSVAHRADSRFILLTSITITAWHKDHRRVQHTCLAYLSFQQLANAPPFHRNRTVYTDPWLSGLAHNTATNILLFRLSICVQVCVCVCVCIHKQHTDGVPKRQLHNPYHCALSVRVCVKCDGWQSLRLAQSQSWLHSQHTLLEAHALL